MLDASSSMDSSLDSIKSRVGSHLKQLEAWKAAHPTLGLEISFSTFNQDYFLQEPSSDFKKLKVRLEKSNLTGNLLFLMPWGSSAKNSAGTKSKSSLL